MSDHLRVGNLQVAKPLFRFVEDEALPGTGVTSTEFWRGVERSSQEIGPRIRAALSVRDDLQLSIDAHLRSRAGVVWESGEQEEFLQGIGYIDPEPAEVSVATTGVDAEISRLAGPQLVVPLSNARFALNAVNARWGSLYDAYYGSDVISREGELAPGGSYNPIRGTEVVRLGRDLLDRFVPLEDVSHRDVVAYDIDDLGLVGRLVGAGVSRLRDPAQLVGWTGQTAAPSAVLLRHHGLHMEIVIDAHSAVGAADRAGVSDIVVEAALSAIMDLEDSVATVDVEDKVEVYRTWLGLMTGQLAAEVTKDRETFIRRMAPDRSWSARGDESITLPGRSVMMVRHVGHHLSTDAVLNAAGEELPEGILDAYVTAACALHDLGDNSTGNSRTGSIYAVKPKMHGAEEVRVTADLLAEVEIALGIPRTTIKLGIMDEERRTSVNLKACIEAARDRVVFVNTGFLDRTGDEIHTSMQAGPMLPRSRMSAAAWLRAYETSNVRVALDCGLSGRGQIGKGMWTRPDDMAAMLTQKVTQPLAGASCGWVPSPTAATLHALHYHEVDVTQRQLDIVNDDSRPSSVVAGLLTIPLATSAALAVANLAHELDANVQSVLGYVVRWIDAGVGCSKVPALDGTALMEDRATCRISSQYVANWVLHGVVSPAQVEDSLRRMAIVVDEQGADDPSVGPMAPTYDSEAFLAARDLLLLGIETPSGYTEWTLQTWRRRKKDRDRVLARAH